MDHSPEIDYNEKKTVFITMDVCGAPSLSTTRQRFELTFSILACGLLILIVVAIICGFIWYVIKY